VTPPEVILDRWIRAQSRNQRECVGYVGKLDFENLDSPSFGSFLRFLQETINTALQLENVNASGGVEHPPFHFDYIEVKDGINAKNAHAFQHGGFSFIAVTVPLVELLWDLSQRLCRSPLVLELLGIDPGAASPETLHLFLFQLQLTFVVSHEYTHHVHQHCDHDPDGTAEAWTEFLHDQAVGGIDDQAQELDADAYAIYLGLANFLRGGGRNSGLAQVGRQDSFGIHADGVLLTCFFLAITTLFCALWREDIAITSIWQFRHPPAPVRIEYAIRVAQMWCGQNQSVPDSWFAADRFQDIFRAALDAIGGGTRRTWDAHVSLLRGTEGVEYDRCLRNRFDAIRQKKPEPAKTAAVAEA
jgi:hypothetical protein